MSELRALSLLPFVPSGADYDGSRRLFVDLGFDEIWEHDGYANVRRLLEAAGRRIPPLESVPNRYLKPKRDA